MEETFEEGRVLLIDKPSGWTSFDAVNKIRRTIKVRKVGHAGTLDPLATGLLIICTGKMTKQIDNYQAQEKEYTGFFGIGKTTPSFDLETPFDSERDWSYVKPEIIISASRELTGTILQIPPMYSAIRVDGKRMYLQARKGKTVALQPREVQVPVFEITSFELPLVGFRIVCSKGTYIRSLVRDIGEALGTGAYLHALRRTRIGTFLIEDAQTVSDFVQKNHHSA
jgi:tRNA pseudouridine55 synthase